MSKVDIVAFAKQLGMDTDGQLTAKQQCEDGWYFITQFANQDDKNNGVALMELTINESKMRFGFYDKNRHLSEEQIKEIGMKYCLELNSNISSF